MEEKCVRLEERSTRVQAPNDSTRLSRHGFRNDIAVPWLSFTAGLTEARVCSRPQGERGTYGVYNQIFAMSLFFGDIPRRPVNPREAHKLGNCTTPEDTDPEVVILETFWIDCVRLTAVAGAERVNAVRGRQ